MVENVPLYANEAVLSSKCDYFKGMFQSNMRESIETRVVKVSDCSNKIVYLQVLEYLCVDGFTVNIEDHVEELWELTDMYLLEGLKFCILVALERGLCNWNVCKILQDEVKGLNCECDELKRPYMVC
jgi:hypothetical protein